MMEKKKCKNKKCQRSLPEGCKHKYCENCMIEQINVFKGVVKAGLGVAFAAVLTVVTRGKINPKK